MWTWIILSACSAIVIWVLSWVLKDAIKDGVRDGIMEAEERKREMARMEKPIWDETNMKWR